MKNLSFINGRILPAIDAKISVTDLGLQRGYGVFDYVRIYNEKLFHFEDHMKRFFASASAMNLTIPYNDIAIEEIAYQLVEGSELTNPGIRLILTGGESDQTLSAAKSNFIIIAEEVQVYPEYLYSEGAKLLTENYQRELPHVKYLNYLNAMRLKPLMQKENAVDILYYSNDRVSECSRSSIFIVKGNRLFTPGSNVLKGITCNIVINLAKEKIKTELIDITLDELKSAGEVFITSTSKNIMPVTQIDEIIIGNGKPGKVTKMLSALFEEYSVNYV